MKKVLTTSGVACGANISEHRVRVYADAGIIECVRDSAGRRTFQESAVKQAREAHERRTRRIRRT